MKQFIRFAVICTTGLALASCSEIVKKTIQDNPEIIFDAIKKDPGAFVKTAQEAFKAAEGQQRADQEKGEEDKREAQFKDPLKPVLTDSRPVLGPGDAKVTIIEYSDMQCPACQYGNTVVQEIMKDYKGKVKLVLKHFPIESKHPNARRAAEYFEAIALQDYTKAFDFKKAVFEKQRETYTDKKGAEKLFQSFATKVGADLGRLGKDLEAKKDEFTARINKDMEEAQKFNINGTPGYIINGVSLHGAYGAPVFKKIIDRHLGG